ncbi:MAG: ABC transporter permease subunit [Erysipelotrichaceae bacterium]|nr:ABC transporter permease subunit [Erysipelotrichaceae bacterium]
MTKRSQRLLLGSVLLLVLWYLIAHSLNQAILVPSPFAVFKTMMEQCQTQLFYLSLFETLWRIICGFSIALAAALLFAVVTYFYPWFGQVCYPLLLVTRSIPNISYILIVLFWCSAQTSVMVISFFILFPTLYATLSQGLHDVPTSYHDVMKLYGGNQWFDLRYVYLPFLHSYFYTACKSGLSLALKVGIMAEILGQVSVGIGRQLNICRLNLDMSGVFAWTLWIMLLLALMERIIAWLFHANYKR